MPSNFDFSMILLQMSHILCEWLMETYGGTSYTRRGFTMPPHETSLQSPAQPEPSAMSDEEFLTLCANGTPQQIAAAIKNDANVNAANSRGHTTLMMAAMSP